MITASLFAIQSVCEFLTLYDYDITRIKLMEYRYDQDKSKSVKVKTMLFDSVAKLYSFCSDKMTVDDGKPVINVQHYTYLNDNCVSEELPIPELNGDTYYNIAEMTLTMTSPINNCEYSYDMFYNNYNSMRFIDKSELKKSVMSKMNGIIRDENKKQLKRTLLNLESFITMLVDIKYSHNRLDPDGIHYSLDYFNDKLDLIHKDKNDLSYKLRESADY